MRIITVLVGNAYSFPPVLSLLHAFEKMHIDSVFITTKSTKCLQDELKKTTVIEIETDYESINSPIKKLSMIPYLRKELWTLIDSNYNSDSIIWVVTDVTIKYLGTKLTSRKYVLHLLELSQELLYYYKIPAIKLNKEKIGNKALAVVVPEYNRAHLTKTWWNLTKMPCVLPNKPFSDQGLKRGEYIQDDVARNLIDALGTRKIILYQGVMSDERPLDVFIDAVDEYGGEYAFVIMSGGKNIYHYKKSDNYCFIPFVAPPNHLQITSHAHIGVLSYVPTKSTGYSPLNSLYCAPNKTFEYSMFGIPMIGNDIPGLRYLFDTKNIGRCFDEFSIKSVCDSIDNIEREYKTLSSNSNAYFAECDYVSILTEILNKVRNYEGEI